MINNSSLINLKLRRAAAAMIIPIVAIVAGCSVGGGATKSAPQTAQAFLHALANQDVSSACLMIAGYSDPNEGPITRKSPDWQQCQSALRAQLADGGGDDLIRYAHAKVTSADISGDQATVHKADIQGVLNPEFDIKLKSIDGAWYVTGLE